MNEKNVQKGFDTKYYKVNVGRYEYLDIDKINQEANNGSKLITIVHKYAIFERSYTGTQIDIASEHPQAVPFQKCPKCDGQGIVSKPPYIAGDVYQWSSSELTHQCDVCNGAKIISMNPIIK